MTETIYKTIGENIRHFRTTSGMSSIDIANLLGISHQQLSKYERGQDRISIDKLVDICKILKQPLEDFLGMHIVSNLPPRMGLNLGKYFAQVEDPELQRVLVLLMRLVAEKKN